MENKDKLYDFYYKIINSLVYNIKEITNTENRRGYYIPDFKIKDETDSLIVESIKIINLFEGEKSKPILLEIKNLKSFIQYIKLKFKLRGYTTKVKKAKSSDINNDIQYTMQSLSTILNFPFSVYEDIYNEYYKEEVK